MTRSPEDRYRRLLRWYPASWRRLNEDVTVGTMLDLAEHQGRSAPSGGERASAIVQGLGTRLDAVVALGASLIALALAVVSGVLMIWAPTGAGTSALIFITGGVIPPLAALSLVAITRQRGLLSAPRAVLVTFLAVAALGAAGLAQIAWNLAFDFADAGAPAAGIAAVWAPLFGGAWVLGTAAIAAFVDALLVRTSLPRAPAVVLAVVAGACAASAIGLALVSPMTSTVATVGVALLALASARRTPRTERQMSPPVSPPGPSISLRTIATARGLAWMSAAYGAIGISFALTGAMWSPVAIDSTIAMAHGISLAAVAGIPLLGSRVTLGAARHGHSTGTWGPAALTALALGATAVAYLSAPFWDQMAPAFAASAALTGSAIGWWLSRHLPGNSAVRLLTAVLIGAVYAAFIGVIFAPVLALLMPLLAVTSLIWGHRRRRTPLPKSTQSLTDTVAA